MRPYTLAVPPPVPAQPSEKTWHFVEELRRVPYHQPVPWTPRRPADDEVGFPQGLRLQIEFPDPRGLLETAYQDLRFFLKRQGLSAKGTYPLIVRQCETSVREEYVLRVTREGCELCAADTDGIRRGLIFLEDEMLRRGGPFLPLGSLTRTPLIRTRISRCFYGPINRPPKLRDELTDDVDYYPDEYLNRLAHEGVNVLWMTVNFYELLPSKIIPQYGRNAGPRLQKLRRVVAKCERHGIRIYPFCIEPSAFNRPAPELQAARTAHPDLIGHHGAFCTSTEKGQAYLEEAGRTLLTEVPGLGGLILIPVGERLTHCYSAGIPDGGTWPTPNTCPRCSQRKPYEVLADTLAALRRGMDAVDPDAELVAWPYGQFIGWGPEKTIEAAAHFPPGVILQHNFETGGSNYQLGKWRPTWDYWLSYAGPSDLFRQAATAAREHGTRTGAKLQVGCSHEVCTTQVVPAPGLLHRKYTAMHDLGVSCAMHSWYFGTFPSLMTKAAGELSFAPFRKNARRFLETLAGRDWQPYATEVAEAWRWFEKGYSQYPTAHIFGYFGPMHDGPSWPLYLVPRRLPLAPTWQIGYAPSGDYVAECVTNGFTLQEVLTLCKRMTEAWDRGMAILQRLRPKFADQPERLRDLNLAEALGLQFRSGYQILRFYALREKLAEATSPAEKQRLLREMKALVRAERRVTEQLLPLAEADSRLGFHSEAEGYKYHPALLRWRLAQLDSLLKTEFPSVERQAKTPGLPFPDYVGVEPEGAQYQAALVDKRTRSLMNAGRTDSGAWKNTRAVECAHWLRHVFSDARWRKCGYDPMDHLAVPPEERAGATASWQALATEEAVYIAVTCRGETEMPGGAVQVYVEPERTEPRRIFHLGPDGSARVQRDDGYIPVADDEWQVATHVGEREWSAVLRVPWEWLGRTARRDRRFRMNVVATLPVKSEGGWAEASWAERDPAQGRLVWGTLNPATDFGWLRVSG